MTSLQVHQRTNSLFLSVIAMSPRRSNLYASIQSFVLVFFLLTAHGTRCVFAWWRLRLHQLTSIQSLSFRAPCFSLIPLSVGISLPLFTLLYFSLPPLLVAFLYLLSSLSSRLMAQGSRHLCHFFPPPPPFIVFCLLCNKVKSISL